MPYGMYHLATHNNMAGKSCCEVTIVTVNGGLLSQCNKLTYNWLRMV